jgi:hypothetical protein
MSNPAKFNVFGEHEDIKSINYPNCLIFNHMANTGGVAFSQAVMQFGAHGYEAINFVPNTTLEIKEYLYALMSRKDSHKYYFHGHWVNGVDLILNSPATNITILRNPIDRFLSEFFWQHRSDPSCATAPLEMVSEIENWINALSEVGHANFYCYEIAIPSIDKAEFHAHLRLENMRQFSANDLYLRANLILESKYCFVGISELFEESLMYFFRLMGWPKIGPWKRGPHAPGRGAAQAKFSSSDLPVYLVRKLTKLLAADIELYQTWRLKLEDKLLLEPLLGDIEAYKLLGRSG